ncbi:hypothetical protein GJ744_003276 [Endocarpon pusillum]|uniref:Uncharacterized protein n=1 Tax=Endocarpon pusillum TaxID=364733 RepID=A0A8H7DYA9_9EURO|nr:hypothetical protein GJ744_003276 [Endocarpon pusillum]
MPISQSLPPAMPFSILSFLVIFTWTPTGVLFVSTRSPKPFAPGCRLGWITAQPLFIEKLLRITETSTQQPSGFVQLMIAELVIGPLKPSDGGRGGGKDGSGWNMDGWVRGLEGLRGNYETRMQKMSSILEDGKYTNSDVNAAKIEPGRRF